MNTVNPIQEERQQRSRGILNRLREVLPAIQSGYPVDAAYVFGSVARDVATTLSDVDIALLLAEVLPEDRRLKLELSIQSEVEGEVGLGSVDVGSLNIAPLLVKGRIIQHGVMVYERDRRSRVEYLAGDERHWRMFVKDKIKRLSRQSFFDELHTRYVFEVFVLCP